MCKQNAEQNVKTEYVSTCGNRTQSVLESILYVICIQIITCILKVICRFTPIVICTLNS